ncbi:MAG: transglutaminase-like domain-containing protein, partial [Thermoanaerobaculia bacterium]
VGLLMRRELGVRLTVDGPMEVPRASESWMGVYLGDAPQRVGTIHLRQNPEERHGLRGSKMVLDAEMRLNLMGKATDLDLSGSVWRPLNRTQAEFEFGVRSAEYDFKIAGTLADGELAAEVSSAGEVFPLRLPVRGDLVFASGFGAALELPALEVGEEYRIESFDPITLQKGDARIRCVAHETLEIAGAAIATRRLRVTMNGFHSEAWVDAAGEIVRAETPFGLVLQQISATEALAGTVLTRDLLAGAGGAEFLGRTAIRPTGERPFRTASTMTVEVRGLDQLELPSDGVQTQIAAGRYRLTVPAPPGDGATAGPPPEPEALRADSFVQSDHPRIRRQAEEIVADETDPWRRALRIHEWVYTRLEKEAVVSIPSAIEVLENRRGDCNEHTVLFTALARAVGLPTRMGIGVVWSGELEGFYYHACPEVYLDGRWIWMDPTLDQPLADATHLKLLNGGIESWPQLLPYLGRLQIEVLDIR